MSDYQKALDYGCGDHSCFFVKPKGMGTNGGCRCLPTRSTMKWITESFKILAAKDQRIKQLESALKDMGESLRSIAFYDEPDAEKVLWWAMIKDKEKLPITLAHDTEIAREALSRNKSILETLIKEKE